MKLEIYRQIFKKYASSLMQIRPVGIVLFHAEGRIDGQANGQNDETNSHFSQFCELA